jgi:hypothetical protein
VQVNDSGAAPHRADIGRTGQPREPKPAARKEDGAPAAGTRESLDRDVPSQSCIVDRPVWVKLRILVQILDPCHDHQPPPGTHNGPALSRGRAAALVAYLKAWPQCNAEPIE